MSVAAPDSRPLWPHQERAIVLAAEAVRAGHRAVLITAPTGAGKSRAMAEFARRSLTKGRRTGIFTNRRLLTSQAGKTLESQGVRHGYVAAGFEAAALRDVQVLSLQTVSKRLADDRLELPDLDVVHIDEAHSNKAETARAVINHYLTRGAVVIGWTATPLGLGDLYTTLVVAGTPSELRATRPPALVPCDVYAPDEPDMKGVKLRADGEFVGEQAAKRAMETLVFGNVFDAFTRLNPWRRPSLLWAPGVAESRWFVEQFTARGVRAAHIDGETPLPERQDLFAASEAGELPLICSCGVLREGVDCLDAQTEILTPAGWRGVYSGLQAGDCMYALNRASGLLEVVTIERAVSRQARPDERMLTVVGQHVNIRTTEGHEFHIKYSDPYSSAPGRRSESWLTLTGSELATRRSDYHLPVSAETADSPPGVPLSDDEIRLVAWFMTDGGFTQEYFSIAQSKPYHHEIRALLNRLGLDYRERRRSLANTQHAKAEVLYDFLIPKGTHRGSMRRRGWIYLAPYLNKDGSALLHDMTRQQFLVFWEELLKGDGTTPAGRNGRLCCGRKSQADFYMHLAAVRGFAVNCWEGRTRRGSPVFDVRIRDRQWLCSRPSDVRAAKVTLSPSTPGETVWCVTNRLGTLVARRHGKVSVLGNCPWLVHGILVQPCAALTTFLQLAGRLLRAYPGKDRAVLQDHAGAAWRHGSPNADREWDLDDGDRDVAKRLKKRREAGEEPQPITCPKCHGVRAAGPVCPHCGWAHKKSVRYVRMVGGKLVRMVGDVVKRKRQQSDEQKVWTSCLYAAAATGQTLRQAAGNYHRRTGTWPLPSLSNVPPHGSLDWSRPVVAVYPWLARRRGK